MCNAAAQNAIGVFDSGLGGLTAVRELRRILPGEDIVYFGDTGRVPYGTRGRDIIVEYAKQDIAFLLSKGVKAVIAACGTVSSTLPAEVAASLPVPYMGVVESAARAAVLATKTGRIGVIGTPATVASGSYPAAIRRLMPGAAITATACPLFVPLVENGYFGVQNPVTRLVAQDYLKRRGRYAHPRLHTLPANRPRPGRSDGPGRNAGGCGACGGPKRTPYAGAHGAFARAAAGQGGILCQRQHRAVRQAGAHFPGGIRRGQRAAH